MQRLADLVAGKRVVVVGNSKAILERKDGREIDAHDIVWRINLGMPGLHLREAPRISREAVGYRTDIWSTARYWPYVLPPECKAILWMKLTKLGKAERLNLLESYPHCPVIDWPPDLEQEVKAFVGADPGSGIRILYWLKKKAAPASVSIYGFDCWKRVSHWSNTRQTMNHNPKKERAAMEALGFPL